MERPHFVKYPFQTSKQTGNEVRCRFLLANRVFIGIGMVQDHQAASTTSALEG